MFLMNFRRKKKPFRFLLLFTNDQLGPAQRKLLPKAKNILVPFKFQTQHLLLNSMIQNHWDTRIFYKLWHPLIFILIWRIKQLLPQL